jgi:hypothetical protein
MLQTNSQRKSKHTFYVKEMFFSENHGFCEIMWRNIVGLDKPQMTIRFMRIEYRVTKATDTQNMWYLLLSQCINGCMNTPQRYMYIA